MRISWFGLLLFSSLAFTSCSQTPRRDQPDAREAGREAYRASQKLKREAKDAANQLHDAEKEFRQGWGEASREDNSRRDEPRPHTAPPRKPEIR